MKINETDQIQKQLTPVTRAKPQPSDEQAFSNILKEQVDHSSKAPAAGTRQTAFINPSEGAQMNISARFNPRDALDRTESLIGLLEQYRHQLADPATSLKQIDPIIREIGQASENLMPVLDAVPGDDDLKRIVNETLVTASMEVTKFYRGDYI